MSTQVGKLVRKLLQSALLLAASLVIAVLLMEGLLRALPGLLPVELHLALVDRGIPHPEIGNLPAPDSTGTIWTRDFKITHQVDGYGFRNDSPWPASPDMAVIGDSLVFGYGVDIDAAWPQLLSEMTGASVVNLGLIGAGPQQYRRIYDAFVAERQPRLLIIGFFASNEFWDAQQYEGWLESGVGGNYMEWRDFGRQTAAELSTVSGRVGLMLRKHSHVANLVNFARRAMRRRSPQPAELLELGNGEKLRLDLNYLDAIGRNSQPGNPFFDVSVQSLAELQERTAAAGVRLLVVLQPSKEEIYLPFVDRVPKDVAGPIVKELTRLGIEYLDLAPAFRARAQAGESLFFENDGHPNAAGYHLIAEQTAEYLRSAPTNPLALTNHVDRTRAER